MELVLVAHLTFSIAINVLPIKFVFDVSSHSIYHRTAYNVCLVNHLSPTVQSVVALDYAYPVKLVFI
jgi:hypothetical protein